MLRMVDFVKYCRLLGSVWSVVCFFYVASQKVGFGLVRFPPGRPSQLVDATRILAGASPEEGSA